MVQEQNSKAYMLMIGATALCMEEMAFVFCNKKKSTTLYVFHLASVLDRDGDEQWQGTDEHGDMVCSNSVT